MRVSRVLLLLAAAAGCRRARSDPAGRNEVRFEKKDKELVRSKNALQQDNVGGYVRSGVLSPRPDVIGPRDLARLTDTTPRLQSARRVYESEMDMAEELQKEYYEDADRLLNGAKPRQTGVGLRHNLYMRGRSLRPTAAKSKTPTTPSTAHSRTTPGTQLGTLSPSLPGYVSLLPRAQSTNLAGILAVRNNAAGPSGIAAPGPVMRADVDLPTFGDDPAEIAAAAAAAGPADNTNVAAATPARIDKTLTLTPSTLPKFRADNGFSQAGPSDAPQKQRYDNFVKFIQANKDLVEEYIKKKRWSNKVSSRLDRAHGGPLVSHNWSLNPVKHGVASPALAGGRTQPRTTTTKGVDVSLRHWMIKTALNDSKPPLIRQGRLTKNSVEKKLQQVEAEQNFVYGTTGNPVSLDLAPAHGGPIASMRLKGRICQRHVLLPEGPKYNKRGAVYLAAFQPIYNKDFPQTRAPHILLPICCNCCRKSVLGCE